MNPTSPRAVLLSSWTKIRTVRSTLWTLLPTFVVCVGLGTLLGLTFGGSFDELPADQQERWDPLFPAFYGVTLGQLPLVVFGVLVMSGEYTSGTIRASLTAVPRRGLFYCCAIVAGGLAALGVALITVPVTFLVAQAGLNPHGTTFGADGVPTAIVGTALYLTLMCLLAMGVATMLRSSVRALSIMLPLLFLGSQGLGNIPKVKTVTQYLPDQTGWVMMHLTGPGGDALFERPYGPWTGLGITALWAAAALLGGYLVLRRRDA